MELLAKSKADLARGTAERSWRQNPGPTNRNHIQGEPEGMSLQNKAKSMAEARKGGSRHCLHRRGVNVAGIWEEGQCSYPGRSHGGTQQWGQADWQQAAEP